MQALMEVLFDSAYLVLVIGAGIVMLRRGRGDRQTSLFGVMALVLGSGDAFHLVPRIYALCGAGLDNFTAVLGVGRMITSVTMTVFYLILYQVWRLRYGISGRKGVSIAMYSLAAARIALSLLPQNGWTSPNPPLIWGIWRNIPFAAMGAIVVVLFRSEARRAGDQAFRHIWLAVVLSFAFYLPVVLWAEALPVLGALMIPKTCAYVWLVAIGYADMQRRLGAN